MISWFVRDVPLFYRGYIPYQSYIWNGPLGKFIWEDILQIWVVEKDLMSKIHSKDLSHMVLSCGHMWTLATKSCGHPCWCMSFMRVLILRISVKLFITCNADGHKCLICLLDVFRLCCSDPFWRLVKLIFLIYSMGGSDRIAEGHLTRFLTRREKNCDLLFFFLVDPRSRSVLQMN